MIRTNRNSLWIGLSLILVAAGSFAGVRAPGGSSADETGDKDFWSDPKGEFLAAVAAGPVYKMLGKQGLDTDQMPAPGDAILHAIGYLEHAGGHGTIPSDWDVFLKFMQMHLRPGE